MDTTLSRWMSGQMAAARSAGLPQEITSKAVRTAREFEELWSRFARQLQRRHIVFDREAGLYKRSIGRVFIPDVVERFREMGVCSEQIRACDSSLRLIGQWDYARNAGRLTALEVRRVRAYVKATRAMLESARVFARAAFPRAAFGFALIAGAYLLGRQMSAA